MFATYHRTCYNQASTIPRVSSHSTFQTFTFSLDTGGHSREYVAHRNSCITLSKAAPPYKRNDALGGFISALTPGQVPMPLSKRSSSVVLPHCSGAGSAAPSISAPYRNYTGNDIQTD